MPTATDDIDDIEDLIAPGDLKPSDRYYNKKDVIVRKKEKKANGNIENEKPEAQNGACESVTIFYPCLYKSFFNNSHVVDNSWNSNCLPQNMGMQPQQQ